MRTVKIAISLKQPLLERVDDAAQRLEMSRSAFLARAAEELVSKLESRLLLDRLDEAYADAPDDQELDLQPTPAFGSSKKEQPIAVPASCSRPG